MVCVVRQIRRHTHTHARPCVCGTHTHTHTDSDPGAVVCVRATNSHTHTHTHAHARARHPEHTHTHAPRGARTHTSECRFECRFASKIAILCVCVRSPLCVCVCESNRFARHIVSHPLCPIAMSFTADPLSCAFAHADIQAIGIVRYRLECKLPKELVAKIVARVRWSMLKRYIRLHTIVEFWYWYDPWVIHF